VKQFEEAYTREPFTAEAWRKVSAVCIPKKVNSRLNAIKKLSVDVQLSSHVKQLCEQLKKDPLKFSLQNIELGEDSTVVSLQDLRSTCLGASNAAEKAQFYDVVESILCLTAYWHGSECGSSAEKIAHRLSMLGMPKDAMDSAIEQFRALSLRGQKIFTFCSEFLKDIGTVFHLPRDTKA